MRKTYRIKYRYRVRETQPDEKRGALIIDATKETSPAKKDAGNAQKMAPLGASEATPDHIDKEGDVDIKQRRHGDVKHLPPAKMKTRDGTDRGEKCPCGSPGRRGSEHPDGQKQRVWEGPKRADGSKKREKL